MSRTIQSFDPRVSFKYLKIRKHGKAKNNPTVLRTKETSLGFAYSWNIIPSTARQSGRRQGPAPMFVVSSEPTICLFRPPRSQHDARWIPKIRQQLDILAALITVSSRRHGHAAPQTKQMIAGREWWDDSHQFVKCSIISHVVWILLALVIFISATLCNITSPITLLKWHDGITESDSVWREAALLGRPRKEYR